MTINRFVLVSKKVVITAPVNLTDHEGQLLYEAVDAAVDSRLFDLAELLEKEFSEIKVKIDG